MEICSFCGGVIERGTGKTVVLKDGSILHFCSNKCEKNYLKLKRNPIKVKWTLKYKQFKGKKVTEATPKVVKEKNEKPKATGE